MKGTKTMNAKQVNRTLRALDILLSPRSLQHFSETDDANRRQTGRTPYRVALCLSMFAAASMANAQVKGIYDFSLAGDPQNPQVVGVIAQGRDGNMYSTTPASVQNMGASLPTAFKITSAGKMTVIHYFSTTDGTPYSGLTLGTDGSFYGTTLNGGTNGKGTIFKLTPKGVLTTLYNFVGGNDGANPMAPPIEIAGNWYGTATVGGLKGYGTVYKYTPGGAIPLTPLVQFSGTDGSDPVAPLVQGNDGRLYGVTKTSTGFGGPFVVFSVTTSGTDFTYHVVFQNYYVYSEAGLVQGNDGNFYGTVYNGGSQNGGYGQVFKISPSPNYAVTVFPTLNGGSDGAIPMPAFCWPRTVTSTV
jgi:uncharacterized repeat protein (TIGR03803 family)